MKLFAIRYVEEVTVVTQEEYNEWVKGQESFLNKNPDLMADVPDDLRKLAMLQMDGNQ